MANTPRLGSLTDRVELLQSAAGPTLGTVWGKVKKTAHGWSVVLRFRRDLEAGAIISFRGRWLRVLSLENIGERFLYLAAKCEEYQP